MPSEAHTPPSGGALNGSKPSATLRPTPPPTHRQNRPCRPKNRPSSRCCFAESHAGVRPGPLVFHPLAHGRQVADDDGSGQRTAQHDDGFAGHLGPARDDLVQLHVCLMMLSIRLWALSALSLALLARSCSRARSARMAAYAPAPEASATSTCTMNCMSTVRPFALAATHPAARPCRPRAGARRPRFPRAPQTALQWR